MATHLWQSLSHLLAYHCVPVYISLSDLILLAYLFSCLLSIPHRPHKHSSPREEKSQVLYLFYSVASYEQVVQCLGI